MPFTVTMPKLSPTMEEGTIAKWYKAVGDSVEPGELVFEVATDKATIEYNALDGGWLRKILIKDGETAHVNQAVAIFSESKDESIDKYVPTGIAPKESEKAAAAATTSADQSSGTEQRAQGSSTPTRESGFRQPAFIPEQPLSNYSFERPTAAAEKRLSISPLAKKLAAEKGLDLTSIKGSGPSNRIVSRDLDLAQPINPLTGVRYEEPVIPPGTYVEENLTPLRKVVGQRLQEAKTFIPHFYIQQTIDAQPLVSIRDQLQQLGIKYSFNDLIVRACALALKKHPNINTGYNSVNQTVVNFKTIDISIAVSVNGGLITPIVRHADYKSLGEISAEIRSLAKRAKEGQLEPSEYKGGSFTISNLGMYGITNFQAIINPPQAAIIAVSGVQEAAVVKNGQVVSGKVINLSLSCDHRVIDGVAAAEFLKSLQKIVENPAVLLI